MREVQATHDSSIHTKGKSVWIFKNNNYIVLKWISRGNLQALAEMIN